MYRLRQELAEIEKHRDLTRKKRETNDAFTVALVGYTNAGKSTLFNRLTQSEIYADDKLFATLDTTVRKLTLDNGVSVLLCDTVGFINELPHALLNAFKSTLEEATRADLIINVCDASDENVVNHIRVTEQTLGELGVNAPILRVYNKCDKLSGDENLSDTLTADTSTLFVSALTGKNLDLLLYKIKEYVRMQYTTIKLQVNLGEAAKLLARLNKYSAKCKTEYDDNYATVTATLDKKYVNLFIDYIVI